MAHRTCLLSTGRVCSRITTPACCLFLRLCFPEWIKIRRLVETASPCALGAHVLHEGRRMIENPLAQASHQTSNLNVLQSLHFVPLPNDVFDGRPGKEKRLAPKTRIRIDDAGVAFEIASLLLDPGVVQTGQRHRSPLQGTPGA